MAILILPAILALLLAAIGPAHGEPISTTIGLSALIFNLGAGAVTVGTAAAIGGVIVSTGIAVGASLLARAFAPKQPDGQTDATGSGVQEQIRIGADIPRNRVFGKQALAGQLAYWNIYNADNHWLQLVYVLGSGPHDLFGIISENKRLTLGAVDGALGNVIAEYNYG